MRLQKLLFILLLAATLLTIFTRGQEVIWDFQDDSGTSLSSTGYLGTARDFLVPPDPLVVLATGEVLATWWIIEQLTGASISWEVFWGNTNITWAIQTGLADQIPQSDVPNLLISEVYYDGTDERIEISNIGISDFSGKIQISGSISLSTQVLLPIRQSILLIKPSADYSRIDITVPRVTTSTFGLTDTKAINLILSTSGQILDSFVADTGLVVKLDNKKTSIQKTYLSGQRIITWTIVPVNVISPYIANPWILVQEIFPNTGVVIVQTGFDKSWQFLTWVEATGFLSPLKITEIWDYTWQFSQFIEIKADSDRDGTIFFSWSFIKDGFFLDEKLNSWDYLLIVASDNWWLSNQKKIENASLKLQNSWFLSIYGQSRQVFDTIDILSIYTGKSLYYWGISQSGMRLFDKVDSFSPGFSQDLLWYFLWENTDCSIVSQPVIGLTTNLSTSWMSIVVQTPDPGMVQIDGLVFKGSESITLSSLRTGDIDVSDHKWYLLTKAIGKNERGKTKKYLTWTLVSGQSLTISKTFWFLDGGGCVSLWYSGSLYDTYCYTAPIKETTILKEIQEKELTGLNQLTGQLSWLQIIPVVKITSLLPNPAGKDSWEVCVISASDNYPFTGFFFKVNTSKHKIAAFLHSWNNIITGSLWLVNKAACVELWYDKDQLDTFCYTNPKENQRFGQTNTVLTSIAWPDISLLNQTNFLLTGNKICIGYSGQALRCRVLPASKTSIKLKNQNKLYQTYAGLLEDYLSKNRSTLLYQTPLKDYLDAFTAAKKAINKSQSEISISGQVISVQDLATQIRLKTTTGSVESWYENSIPQRILRVQKLWRRGALIWASRSNFFSISGNPNLECRGTRCFANAAPNWSKCEPFSNTRTNSKDQICRKQQLQTNSPPAKYVGFWTTQKRV